MLHWAYRITPVAMALMLLPAAAQANEAASGAQLPAIETKLQHAKTQVLRQDNSERQQRVAIAERANNVFSLLASEMVLDQGQVGSALATYMVMLERTRDPEVAERGMEIALNADAVPQDTSMAAAIPESTTLLAVLFISLTFFRQTGNHLP